MAVNRAKIDFGLVVWDATIIQIDDGDFARMILDDVRQMVDEYENDHGKCDLTIAIREYLNVDVTNDNDARNAVNKIHEISAEVVK